MTTHSTYKTITTPFGNFAITPKDYSPEWKTGTQRYQESRTEFWLVYIGDLNEMPVSESFTGEQTRDMGAFQKYKDEHGEKPASFLNAVLSYEINRVKYSSELELHMVKRDGQEHFEASRITSAYSSDNPLTNAAQNKLLACVGYQAAEAMKDEKWLAWIELQRAIRDEHYAKSDKATADKAAAEAYEKHQSAIDAIGAAQEAFDNA